MDVHAGSDALHGAENVAIVIRRQTVWQAALDADFGSADLRGLQGLLRDIFRFEEVGVGFAWAAAEGTKLASHEANISEVDIAVNDVSDEIAAEFGAQQVRGRQQAEQVVAFGVR
jgi:hypothetical protein